MRQYKKKIKCEKDRESEKDRVMWWVKITSGLSLTEEVELSVCLDFQNGGEFGCEQYVPIRFGHDGDKIQS